MPRIVDVATVDTLTDSDSLFVNSSGSLRQIAKADSGMIYMDLLWTNASPNSDFATQTINLDLSKYDAIKVFYLRHAGSPYQSSDEIEIGTQGIIGFVEGGTTAGAYMAIRYRYITSVTEVGVTFSTGYIGWAGQAETKNESMAIPVKIYGIKGVK